MRKDKIRLVGTQAQIYIGHWASTRRHNGPRIDQQ